MCQNTLQDIVLTVSLDAHTDEQEKNSMHPVTLY